MSDMAEIMKTDVVTVEKGTPVMEAIAKLVEFNFTGLPVVDSDNCVVGILSEKDVLTLAVSIHDESYDSDASELKVEDFMTKDVITADITDSLTAVCSCLMKNKFRRMPVLAKEKLIGIVSRKDIITYIMNNQGYDLTKTLLSKGV